MLSRFEYGAPRSPATVRIDLAPGGMIFERYVDSGQIDQGIIAAIWPPELDPMSASTAAPKGVPECALQ
jgi:hypothetical protein